ncbi:hypothetical protein CUW_1916 [Turicibacter sanguinis PC909]|uniref:DUF1492 domain-containing protein n=1 Tax=Turicibacter sanguinis PC909 TaxID=702450 RepID=A0ABM9ZYR1_9FIRM|nr:DUF1492 domain-containing protein [Turicibacter sanguinis]EFF62510.1 hypothetical protein CUW_1916 [Turicibacter sanguinis PC909]
MYAIDELDIDIKIIRNELKAIFMFFDYIKVSSMNRTDISISSDYQIDLKIEDDRFKKNEKVVDLMEIIKIINQFDLKERIILIEKYLRKNPVHQVINELYMSPRTYYRLQKKIEHELYYAFLTRKKTLTLIDIGGSMCT